MAPPKGLTHDQAMLIRQEAGLKGASKRVDRGLQDRLNSLRQASEVHEMRTGRPLRVSEQAVLGGIYEECDPLPTQPQHHQHQEQDNGNQSMEGVEYQSGSGIDSQAVLRSILDAPPPMKQLTTEFSFPEAPQEANQNSFLQSHTQLLGVGSLVDDGIGWRSSDDKMDTCLGNLGLLDQTSPSTVDPRLIFHSAPSSRVVEPYSNNSQNTIGNNLPISDVQMANSEGAKSTIIPGGKAQNPSAGVRPAIPTIYGGKLTLLQQPNNERVPLTLDSDYLSELMAGGVPPASAIQTSGSIGNTKQDSTLNTNTTAFAQHPSALSSRKVIPGVGTTQTTKRLQEKNSSPNATILDKSSSPTSGAEESWVIDLEDNMCPYCKTKFEEPSELSRHLQKYLDGKDPDIGPHIVNEIQERKRRHNNGEMNHVRCGLCQKGFIDKHGFQCHLGDSVNMAKCLGSLDLDRFHRLMRSLNCGSCRKEGKLCVGYQFLKGGPCDNCVANGYECRIENAWLRDPFPQANGEKVNGCQNAPATGALIVRMEVGKNTSEFFFPGVGKIGVVVSMTWVNRDKLDSQSLGLESETKAGTTDDSQIQHYITPLYKEVQTIPHNHGSQAGVVMNNNTATGNANQATQDNYASQGGVAMNSNTVTGNASQGGVVINNNNTAAGNANQA
ncbi:hypothetical protein G7Y89_g9953 [Cudoniella acicularis]|uniref:C2H2-type domain-containing protein n=1 Tax=Cudoniella acicularis TaxID=354080 RepID=A0A8H4W231_9HELO|nr:hypothetical protein G7Y89_g9953 [Cudoniella acicularis]